MSVDVNLNINVTGKVQKTIINLIKPLQLVIIFNNVEHGEGHVKLHLKKQIKKMKDYLYTIVHQFEQVNGKQNKTKQKGRIDYPRVQVEIACWFPGHPNPK